MRKRIYKIHCWDCKATMAYRGKERAIFESVTHADLYNHDVTIEDTVVNMDMLFLLEGY